MVRLSLLAGLVPVLALPVRHRKENGDDDGGQHLQVVAVEAQGQDDLDDQIVNNRAEGHAQQLERKVMEDAAEDNLADDDGCQADDDGAAAGVDIGKALVLRVKGHWPARPGRSKS